MSEAKIILMGTSGAEKNSDLLGLYQMMTTGFHGYTVAAAKYSEDAKLRNSMRQFREASQNGMTRAGEVLPREYTLRYGSETVLLFQWLNYTGNFFRQMNLKGYGFIAADIMQSDCLVIGIDGLLLTGCDYGEKAARVKQSCDSINQCIRQYFVGKSKLPPVVVMVTDYEQYRNDTSMEELQGIIREALDSLFVTEGTPKLAAIIPTSVRLPLNLHLPLFVGSYFALGDKISALQETLHDHEDEFRTKMKESREQNRIANLEMHRESILVEKKQTLESLKAHREKLLAELEPIPYVFVDGERAAFGEVVERMVVSEQSKEKHNK